MATKRALQNIFGTQKWGGAISYSSAPSTPLLRHPWFIVIKTLMNGLTNVTKAMTHPCTVDSSILGAFRRPGQDATNTAQQGC